jgi:hypothetical protein
MSKFLKVTLLAVVFIPLGAAQALSQGSNQAADDALNWAAAGGHYGSATASYGQVRRHWRHWR